MKSKLMFLILLSFLYTGAYADGKIKIRGTVKDLAGRPVENAVILADGQLTGISTNARGRYTIRVSKDAQSIGVIAPGNVIDADLIDGRNRIDFRLIAEVIGREVISEYDSEGNRISNAVNYSSVDEMILREYSGINYTNGSYIIQNARNNTGSIPALLIVDGAYVNNFEGISPSRVESIDVLDGTSATIYGTRAYGGAIIIKTRK